MSTFTFISPHLSSPKGEGLVDLNPKQLKRDCHAVIPLGPRHTHGVRIPRKDCLFLLTAPPCTLQLAPCHYPNTAFLK